MLAVVVLMVREVTDCLSLIGCRTTSWQGSGIWTKIIREVTEPIDDDEDCSAQQL
jgi:hypothetical protein